MSDLVSIIIPVFNVDKYIGKTIETLLNQTYLNIEILLIDDGSTDESGKICDVYAGKYNKIKVFHQKNKGVSSARNLGINNAKGKYIIFIDGDDYVTSEYVNSLYNEIIINKADMAVQMYLNYYSDNKVFKNMKEDINMNMSGIEFIDFQILGRRDTSSCVKIYSKDIIDKFNIRFDETITNLEDTLFLFYYCKCCNKIRYTSDINYFRRVRYDGVTFSSFNEKKLTALKVFDVINKELIKLNNKLFIEKNLKNKFKTIIGFCSDIIFQDYKNDKLLTSLFLEAKNILLSLNGNIEIKFKVKYLLLLYLPNLYKCIRTIKNKIYKV